MLSQDITFDLFFHRISYDWKKVDPGKSFNGVDRDRVMTYLICPTEAETIS